MCERTERWISNLPSTLLHSMHLKTEGIRVVPTFLLILSVELVQDLISNQERVIFGIYKGKTSKTGQTWWNGVIPGHQNKSEMLEFQLFSTKAHRLSQNHRKTFET